MTPQKAAQIARFTDGAVIGSAIVARIASGLQNHLRRGAIVKDVSDFCDALASAVHSARS
jgi:tryptophan synthase alpha subunit